MLVHYEYEGLEFNHTRALVSFVARLGIALSFCHFEDISALNIAVGKLFSQDG